MEGWRSPQQWSTPHSLVERAAPCARVSFQHSLWWECTCVSCRHQQWCSAAVERPKMWRRERSTTTRTGTTVAQRRTEERAPKCGDVAAVDSSETRTRLEAASGRSLLGRLRAEADTDSGVGSAAEVHAHPRKQVSRAVCTDMAEVGRRMRRSAASHHGPAGESNRRAHVLRSRRGKWWSLRSSSLHQDGMLRRPVRTRSRNTSMNTGTRRTTTTTATLSTGHSYEVAVLACSVRHTVLLLLALFSY
jgi:hypothetical protein